MQIHPSTGRALDISGAFAFLALFIGCLLYGFNLFAFGCGVACLAFVHSWRVWTAPDEAEERFNRTFCALFAIVAVVVFVVAIMFEVLA